MGVTRDPGTYLRLPIKEVGDGHWRRFAVCRGVNPSVFFPARGDHDAIALALSYCNRCPAQQACLEYGIKNRTAGVYGGKTENQRKHLRYGKKAS